MLIAVGNGLVSTFDPATSEGRWVGYQILLGAGSGSALQMVGFALCFQSGLFSAASADRQFRPKPMIAVQNTLQPVQIPVAMALLMFSQTFGGALFLSFSDTIFTNSLKALIPTYAPSVNAMTVVNAGANGFRSLISGSNLVSVLVAYAKSVNRVFYLTASAGVCCFIFTWGMGWKDIRKKKEVSKA